MGIGRARTARRVVLVVGPVPPPVHGSARVTGLVLDGLRAAGADVIFRDTSAADDAPRMLFLLDRLRIHLSICGLLVLRRNIRTVYLTGAARGGLWFQASVIAVARLVGARIFFHHHSFAPLRRTDPGMRTVVVLAGRDAEHIALCEGMAESLRARYPRVARVRVCSNAGLLESAEDVAIVTRWTEADRDGADVVLGHLSNLFVDKGLDVVGETMRRARAAGLPVRLLLAGRCLSPEAEALVAELLAQFPDRVDYRGQIAPTAVPAFMDELDVFVFPSRFRNEAEPLVVLEAARAGVPTVAYDVGCLAAIVREPGRLVPLGGDLPARVISLLDAGRIDRRAVAAGFSAARSAALLARDELIADLCA